MWRQIRQVVCAAPLRIRRGGDGGGAFGAGHCSGTRAFSASAPADLHPRSGLACNGASHVMGGRGRRTNPCWCVLSPVACLHCRPPVGNSRSVKLVSITLTLLANLFEMAVCGAQRSAGEKLEHDNYIMYRDSAIHNMQFIHNMQL